MSRAAKEVPIQHCDRVIQCKGLAVWCYEQEEVGSIFVACRSGEKEEKFMLCCVGDISSGGRRVKFCGREEQRKYSKLLQMSSE